MKQEEKWKKEREKRRCSNCGSHQTSTLQSGFRVCRICGFRKKLK